MVKEEGQQEEKRLHEVNRYGDPAFPVGMYVVTRERIIPEGRGYLDLHWHEELQLTLVTDGSATFQVNGVEYALEAGQAIFINRNFLHITTRLTAGGRYVSFNFPERLLGFYAGSRMEQDDVLPFTGSSTLAAVVFTGKEPWEAEILCLLRELQTLFAQKESHLEYFISMKLISIWYLLITHIGAQARQASRGEARKQERIRCMLTFIHENYMHSVKLRDIAQAASVSVGECCRCFQEMVRESPGQYLLSYRLCQAMDQLNSSEATVTEIAAAAGFSDTSHFIQYFKRKTGMTPREYRGKK